MISVARSKHNPLITPRKHISWQSVSACNGSVVKDKKKIHIVYRAMSHPDKLKTPDHPFSTIGYAESPDGVHFEKHRQLIVPEKKWEEFGCEDPRITEIDGTFYIFYTALELYPFRKEGIKVAVAISKDLKQIEEKHLVTTFNAKAMALFPEKINGKYAAILTVNTDQPPPPTEVAIRYFDKIEDIWDKRKWNTWYRNLEKHTLSLKRHENDHAEVGAPPIKTKKGWLVLYSHTENYYSEDKRFGVEAVLLDLKDPQKVVGRTNFPILAPEEFYENHGHVPHVTFPSGAYVEKDILYLYYGAADTTTCRASMRLDDVLEAITGTKELVTRFKGNPILSPIKENEWEARDVFNPAALDIDKEVHIIYRAMSEDNTSTMGYAKSVNGFKITERLPAPVYGPRIDAEMKGVQPTGNSGCEDPRLTLIGDTIFMCYTAYNGIHPPRVAITSISKKDFLRKEWDWSEPIVLTDITVDDKDACILPEKVNGKYMLIHRIAHHICADFSDTLQFEPGQIDSCVNIFGPRHGMWDGIKVGIAGTPNKTKEGWLMLYHAVGHDSVYRVGAALLDLNDPTHVLSRTALPIFEPREVYEKEGEIPNVVFPGGHIIRGNKLFIYYGAADKVVGVATLDIKHLLKILKPLP